MNEKIEALEAEVRFLRKLVTKLTAAQDGPVIIYEIERKPSSSPVIPMPYTNPYPYPTGPYFRGDQRYTPSILYGTNGFC
jgi:hypothetical protein